MQCRPCGATWTGCWISRPRPAGRVRRGARGSEWAQDVQRVFPDLVNEDENGYLALPYDKFGILSIAGLQELRKEKDQQVAELQKENRDLQEQNALLLQKFEDLNSRLSALEGNIR